MDYFKILNFIKEPFSNSPDPEFFFESRQHKDCLQQLEISLRLRRGLNVVIGDVGTGKTTLCRHLIRMFNTDEKVETHIILDPSFSNPHEFLSFLVSMLGKSKRRINTSEQNLKGRIKEYFFSRGVDEQKIIILMIDEGQKMPEFCLEILRELLNFETNQYKLLQIVIFAQKEFKETLKKHANFADRINLYHFLSPLNFQDTRAMIRFRLEKASGSSDTSSLFSYLAMWSVYKTTRGYPRKIIHLCHRIILALIMQNRYRVSWSLAHACAKGVSPGKSKKYQWATAVALAGLVAALVLSISALFPSKIKKVPWEGNNSNQISSQIHEVSEDIKVVTLKKSQNMLALHKSTTGVLPKILTKPSTDGLHKNLPEKISKEPNEPFIQEQGFPKLLGQITVREGDTIGVMITKIYGSFHANHLKSMAFLNPQIPNLDIINVGDRINFPAIPITPDYLSLRRSRWIQVAEKKKLEKAYDFLRAYPKDAPAVCIIPYWNKMNGLKFAIVLQEDFVDEEYAQDLIHHLPPMIASSLKSIKQWEEGTIFFSKPTLKETCHQGETLGG
jgi:general secretion pathway protein A